MRSVLKNQQITMAWHRVFTREGHCHWPSLAPLLSGLRPSWWNLAPALPDFACCTNSQYLETWKVSTPSPTHINRKNFWGVGWVQDLPQAPGSLVSVRYSHEDTDHPHQPGTGPHCPCPRPSPSRPAFPEAQRQTAWPPQDLLGFLSIVPELSISFQSDRRRHSSLKVGGWRTWSETPGGLPTVDAKYQMVQKVSIVFITPELPSQLPGALLIALTNGI